MIRSATGAVLRRALARATAPRASAPVRALAAAAKPTIKVTFVRPDGTRVEAAAPIGDSLLEVAHAHGVDIEGACGGETACSTCHVILSDDVFKRLPECSEAEEDMLDLAAGLTKTSRLGCQVIAAANVDGMVVTLPKEVSNHFKKDE